MFVEKDVFFTLPATESSRSQNRDFQTSHTLKDCKKQFAKKKTIFDYVEAVFLSDLYRRYLTLQRYKLFQIYSFGIDLGKNTLFERIQKFQHSAQVFTQKCFQISDKN
jgi:hypothetical protein